MAGRSLIFYNLSLSLCSLSNKQLQPQVFSQPNAKTLFSFPREIDPSPYSIFLTGCTLTPNWPQEQLRVRASGIVSLLGTKLAPKLPTALCFVSLDFIDGCDAFIDGLTVMGLRMISMDRTQERILSKKFEKRISLSNMLKEKEECVSNLAAAMEVKEDESNGLRQRIESLENQWENQL
ncbi:hypothetical protein PIB30_058232 [Stylosanthes scabra]|uniref:Uncharacterized protein n=1 Tax=Stylosanthes scabra TaxID=79078 RepID=A0ABU6ULY5_9FABA|nr:hypothetical protein [Stylosanthes scabra]